MINTYLYKLFLLLKVLLNKVFGAFLICFNIGKQDLKSHTELAESKYTSCTFQKTLSNSNSNSLTIFFSFLLISALMPNQLLAQCATGTPCVGNGTWTAPFNVVSVNVECWGAGGAGGGSSTSLCGSSRGGGGGGGGYAANNNTPVVPNTGYAWVIGSGGTGVSGAAGNPGGNSTFGGTTVVAIGGAGGKYSNNGSGGTTAGASGHTSANPAGGYNGGQGAAGSGSNGGGGGEGASSGAVGNNAGAVPAAGTGTAGGDGGTGAGTTNNGGNAPATGVSVGGGGGGAASAACGASKAGGSGSPGQVQLTWSICNQSQNPVTGVNFTNLASTSMDVNWTLGAGTTGAMILVRAGTNPADPTTFLPGANAAYGGQAVGSDYIVYSNTGNTFHLTGLSAGVTYNFAIYSYTGNICYDVANEVRVNQISCVPSVGGSIAGGASVCTGTNSTALTLSGQTGSVTKWQYASDAGFTTGLTDVANTTTSLTATNLTATTYYRAVVTSGTCPSANSSSATMTVLPNASITSVTGASPACIGDTPTYTANGVVFSGGSGAWSSSVPANATVTAGGVVTKLTNGSSNITYTITGGCGGTVSALQAITTTAVGAPASLKSH
jgi:trimeric autotransporter adhesin